MTISVEKPDNKEEEKSSVEPVNDQPATEGQRDQWETKVDFVLSLIGLCVGLGNVWRFPYLAYENGGGAFLIPYLLALFLGGIPMLFMELSIGQMSNIGGLGVWQACPLFKGVGYAAAIMAFWLSVYYIVLLAYAAYYFFNSLHFAPMVWNICDGWWNTECCRSKYPNIPSMGNYSKLALFECEWANASMPNGTFQRISAPDYLLGNVTRGMDDKSNAVLPLVNWTTLQETAANLTELCGRCPDWTMPEAEYWERNVLERSSGIDNPDGVRPSLALCLLLMWLLVYFCLWKGVKWTGKVVYFTALFPYVLLVSFFILGLTLPGSSTGIKYYLKPDPQKLLNSKVWLDAVSQIFFSYGLGLGTHIALGSYNKRNNNCYRDALVVSLVNSSTSIFAGFVVFSLIGFMSYTQNIPISEVARSGPGLVFLVYPSGISQLPFSPMWCAFIFFMIIIIGLDSQFCTLEGLITAVIDEWPQHFRHRRELLLAAVCVVSYLIGLSTVTRGGMYVFRIFDHYAASGMALLFLVFFECIAFSWSYGVDRFIKNIEDMMSIKLSIWWKLCWLIFTPFICGSVFLFSAIKYTEVEYENYVFPVWAHVMGWMIALSSIGVIPLYIVYSLYHGLMHKESGTWQERIMLLLRPPVDFGSPNSLPFQDVPTKEIEL